MINPECCCYNMMVALGYCFSTGALSSKRYMNACLQHAAKGRDFSTSGSVQEKLLAQPRRTTITRDQAHGNRAIMRVSFYTPRSTRIFPETLYWPIHCSVVYAKAACSYILDNRVSMSQESRASASSDRSAHMWRGLKKKCKIGLLVFEQSSRQQQSEEGSVWGGRKEKEGRNKGRKRGMKEGR